MPNSPMSSLSLPRVLQQRKTSLEQERENFEKFQASSISKAINQIESPVKEKHVRIAIIGTFRDKSPELFWQCILKIPIQENRIIAWKFCHVLHKLMREGHQQTIPYSQRHKKKIADLGKLWSHLKEGYGKLIQQYCKLLIAKLEFHGRNPGFPGNLVVSSKELEKIGENDINNYFQMSVEMFDYMDEILTLQECIFGSLDMSRSNSMTSSGQCRLAPLIQCIQDSSQLYDYCVKILFKLHAQLPPDVLSGHRQRFLKQFPQLRDFYQAASNLQYFKNLIQIPLLPENPPNILVQADLRTYVTPVVIMSEIPAEGDAVENGGGIASDTLLVDLVPPTSAMATSHSSTTTAAESSLTSIRCISPELITQRDNLIEHLQNELSSYQGAMIQLRQRIIELEESLAAKDEQLTKERATNIILSGELEELKLSSVVEEKAKVMEEKFNKLKEVYSKLREEHIQLIRQKAGIEKALIGGEKMTKFARAANRLISSIKADVDKQLANVKSVDLDKTTDRAKWEEEFASLQATADAATEQNEELMRKMELTLKEKDLTLGKLEECRNAKAEMEKSLRWTTDERKAIMKESVDEILKEAAKNLYSPCMASASCAPVVLDKMFSDLQTAVGAAAACHWDKPVVLAHFCASYMLFGKAASNASPDMDAAEKMVATCERIGEECRRLLRDAVDGDSEPDCEYFLKMARELAILNNDAANCHMNHAGESPESLSDLVENELADMDKAIEEAAARIQEMLRASRAADSGLKLEVNEKILDSCTELMRAIRALVQKSRLLQAEIVASASPNSASSKEFYKKHHQWTEGLISAAKAVGMGAKYLLTAADDAVIGNAKLERLIVAAQGVAASTAQLVVASRVKAEPNSQNLRALSSASKDVTNATGNVVATVKSCAQLVEDTEDADFSGLTQHQAKRLEMDTQVRVLELEAGLEKERLKLAALRRFHYQLEDDAA